MGATNSAADDINAMEIHHWYGKFMKECPSGQLSLHEFKGLLGLQGMNLEANRYIDQVFSTFDMNKQPFTFPIFKDVAKLCRSIDRERIDRQLCSSLGPILPPNERCSHGAQVCPKLHQPPDGILGRPKHLVQGCTWGKSGSLEKDGFIDFLEFIAAINLVLRGKIDQKLKWYFKLYDADGNGSIDRKELLSIITAVQAINGHQGMNPEEFTAMLFQKIDVNGDGELTLEEFINGIEKDASLLEVISKSFDLSNVLKTIQNGRRRSI